MCYINNFEFFLFIFINLNENYTTFVYFIEIWWKIIYLFGIYVFFYNVWTFWLWLYIEGLLHRIRYLYAVWLVWLGIYGVFLGDCINLWEQVSSYLIWNNKTINVVYWVVIFGQPKPGNTFFFSNAFHDNFYQYIMSMYKFSFFIWGKNILVKYIIFNNNYWEKTHRQNLVCKEMIDSIFLLLNLCINNIKNNLIIILL